MGIQPPPVCRRALHLKLHPCCSGYTARTQRVAGSSPTRLITPRTCANTLCVLYSASDGRMLDNKSSLPDHSDNLMMLIHSARLQH
eukprot:364252-Chlamydomonas_euryale.AAC.4